MCATFTLDIDTCICILYLASMKLLVHLTEAEWFEFDQICGYFSTLNNIWTVLTSNIPYLQPVSYELIELDVQYFSVVSG